MWQMLQEAERKLHYWEYEQNVFINQSCIVLRIFLFVHLWKTRCCVENEGTAFRWPPPSCIGNWSFGAAVEAFFLLPQVPSSVQYLFRLLWEGGRKKKKRNILPIAILISELLYFSFPPSSRGSFPTKVFDKTRTYGCFCMKHTSLIY